MNKCKTLLIIPAYNEEASIEKTLLSVRESNYDYIVINDGSTDCTEQILQDNNYHHINLFTNLGIGGAVQTGYKYAYEMGYDIAVQFDADGQHDISYIPTLIQPIIDQKADLTIGSCFIDKSARNTRSSKTRRIGIHFLSSVIKTFSGKQIHDPTSGFRAANKRVIKYFAQNYPLEYPEPISNFELLRNNGYIIKEVPVKMHKRLNGKSSISAYKTLYAGFNVLLSIMILSLERKERKRHD